VEGVLAAETKQKIVNAFAAKFRGLNLTRDTPNSTKDLADRTARSLEVVRLRQLGGDVYFGDSTPWTIAFFDGKSSLDHLISNFELTLIFVHNWTDLVKYDTKIGLLSHKLPGLCKLAVSDLIASRLGEKSILQKNLDGIELVSLGHLNAPKLTGEIFGRGIFAAGA
jgi:hypothetical protein